MVVHLWGKFFMAAWRGRRALTWMTGAVSFLVSIGAAFTGYLSQQNFDSQWIGGQAKDGLNASGVGAFFNVLNFGQMLLWHVLLLPLVIALLVGGHILLVRRRGVVPPLPAPRSPAMTVPGYPLAPDPVRRVAWCEAPLRPRQGGCRRPRRRRRADGPPRGDLLLTRRPAGHVGPVGELGAE